MRHECWRFLCLKVLNKLFWVHIFSAKWTKLMKLVHYDAFEWTKKRAHEISVEIGFYHAGLMQKWWIGICMTHAWPISLISFILHYGLKISCLAWSDIGNVNIDISLYQNALNELFIVIIPHFLVDNAKQLNMTRVV